MLEDVGLLVQVHTLIFPGLTPTKASNARLAHKLRALAIIADSTATGAGDTAQKPHTDNQRPSPGIDEQEGQESEGLPLSKKQRKVQKVLNFSQYRHRHIALEVLYIGWKYHGFASQPGETDTVEGQLFQAMRKTKLVPEEGNWESMSYSRCGRTDRGVSALSQVVALRVRSAAKLTEPERAAQQECDYALLLNRALPKDIRILGWSDVSPNFHARFQAQHREYKYFIVQSGELDLEAMQQASRLFVGQHDYRNFCKVDAAHVNHFTRHILDFRIQPLPQCRCGDKVLYEVHIRGTAFLWHQVRCMVAVLVMVGQGLEEPSVVQQLLDVGTADRKPQYNMAPEEPLLFYACRFENLHFTRPARCHAANLEAVNAMVDKQLAGLGLLYNVLQYLKQEEAEVCGATRPQAPKHVKLLERVREPALEERFAKHGRLLDL